MSNSNKLLTLFSRDLTLLERQAELDWRRGLMLVLMTITHLPTWFSSRAGQPFGFVSAAGGGRHV